MRKLFKSLPGLFGSNFVITDGNDNSATSAQTPTVRILKGRDPNGNYLYKMVEIRDILSKELK